ncbi:MAG: hypothetical protein ABIU77_22820 [Ferruginibacter sp.]|jgi:hypothetical protein
MKSFKKIMRVFRLLLFALMLSVCMVLGIAPVLPKRKQEIAIEINKDEAEKKESASTGIALNKK